MNNKDITNALAELNRTSATLEEIYCDNGGEVTEETAEIEDQVEALKALLNTEGVDSLGRWLKSKEDELDTLKAEKAAIDRRMKAVKGTIDYIKVRAGLILRATGQVAVKGLLYGFKQATSTKNSILTEALDDAYLETATEAARNAGLPIWCDVVLKASVKSLQDYAAANDGEGLAFLETTSEETSTFTKPRKPKAEKTEE